jgi:HNH endonuclease
MPSNITTPAEREAYNQKCRERYQRNREAILARKSDPAYRAAKRSYAAKYRAENVGKVKACKKKYQQEKLEARRQAHLKWCEENRELINSRNELRRVQALAKKKELRRKIYLKKRNDPIEIAKRKSEKVRSAARESARKRRAEHPDKVNICNRAIRARRLSSPGTHTEKDVLDMWERQKKRCAVPNCTFPITEKGPDKFHVDHIVPLSKMGTNGKENLQILCKRHNVQKNNSDDIEWAQRVTGRLFVL